MSFGLKQRKMMISYILIVKFRDSGAGGTTENEPPEMLAT